MADLILHHYPSSPFAEKVRLALGHKGLAWKSVFVPAIMPKPDVVALTGGYRKTPFLQIGSDIYCDTALIFDVLEHLQSAPSLYPATGKGLARTVAQWADSMLFPVAMGYNFQPKGAATLFTSPEQAAAFRDDRSKMGMPRVRPGDAAATYRSYLRRISDMLSGQDYLLGNAPCVADFACYHPLWFTRTLASGVAHILDATPAVLAWMDRMAAIGHGSPSKSNAAEAIAIAAASAPVPLDAPDALLAATPFQDEHGIPLGSRVSIAFDGFGPEPTEGTLIAATRTHYSLERHDERAGKLHVHFPRVGFALRKADAA